MKKQVYVIHPGDVVTFDKLAEDVYMPLYKLITHRAQQTLTNVLETGPPTAAATTATASKPQT